jgi:hypothetical protein
VGSELCLCDCVDVDDDDDDDDSRVPSISHSLTPQIAQKLEPSLRLRQRLSALSLTAGRRFGDHLICRYLGV